MAKILNGDSLISIGKFILAIVVGALALSAAYFTMEMSQNERITKVTTSLDNHIEESKETFEKLDRTLTEQRQINERTSNALTEVTVIQKALKEENGRLCKKVEDLESR